MKVNEIKVLQLSMLLIMNSKKKSNVSLSYLPKLLACESFRPYISHVKTSFLYC